MLDVLREAGYAPAAEAPDGEVIALGAEPPRAPARQPVRSVAAAAPTSVAHLAEIVRRIRSGDALTEMTPGTRAQPIAQQVPGVTSAATMGMLREAIRDERTRPARRGRARRHRDPAHAPADLDGRRVRARARNPAATGCVSFPLHRITAATARRRRRPDGADDG